jgi:hypothetical protein
MSLITLEECPAGAIALPADDDVAQDIIDEQEAWLARRIGLLVGDRTETFYVGLGETRGKLGLARYTDESRHRRRRRRSTPTLIRLIDRGAGVVRAYAAATPLVDRALRHGDLRAERRAARPQSRCTTCRAQAASRSRLHVRADRRLLVPAAPGPAPRSRRQRRAIVGLAPAEARPGSSRSAARPPGPDDPVINRPEPVDVSFAALLVHSLAIVTPVRRRPTTTTASPRPARRT